MRRFLAGCLAVMLCLAQIPALAGGRVGAVGEAEPFAPGTELLHLYVLDLMGADCMLLRHQGQNLLIDLGGESQYPQLRAMLNWLKVAEVSVFNTHPHGDHVGGVFPLLDGLKVSAFYTCFDEDETNDRSRQPAVIKRLKEAGVPIHRLADGDRMPFEGAELTVHQQAGMPVLNDCSAMVYLRFKEATMLLTGDISQASMTFFSKRPGLGADIMKVPHHGVEKMPVRFLRAISPGFVFFTHGSGDTQAAWRQLRQMKIPHLFSTRGIIHFTTDGERWLVEQVFSSDALPEAADSD